METKEYLDIIANEIHRTIVATVDDEGLPVTAAIDMKNLYDEMPNGYQESIQKGLGVVRYFSRNRCVSRRKHALINTRERP